MGKKSALTPEQRTQLVLRLLSKEEPAAQIARRAGVSEQSLYRWREEFLKAGANSFMLKPFPVKKGEFLAELGRVLQSSDSK